MQVRRISFDASRQLLSRSLAIEPEASISITTSLETIGSVSSGAICTRKYVHPSASADDPTTLRRLLSSFASLTSRRSLTASFSCSTTFSSTSDITSATGTKSSTLRTASAGFRKSEPGSKTSATEDGGSGTISGAGTSGASRCETAGDGGGAEPAVGL